MKWQRIFLLGLQLQLLVLLALSPALSATEIKKEAWVISHFRWAEPSVVITALQVENRYGDIRIRAASSQNSFVSAVMQNHKDSQVNAKVEVSHDHGALSVKVSYPSSPSATSPAADWVAKRRVDLTIFVPATIPIDAKTRNGLIEVKGHKASLQAFSEKGNIVISAEGFTHAHTKHGKIKALLKDGTWAKAPVLETLTGNIQLQLLGDANVRLEIATSGRITTDYSVVIKRVAKGELKKVSATVGKGTHKIFIRSDRGYVDLTRLSIFRDVVAGK